MVMGNLNMPMAAVIKAILQKEKNEEKELSHFKMVIFTLVSLQMIHITAKVNSPFLMATFTKAISLTVNMKGREHSNTKIIVKFIQVSIPMVSLMVRVNKYLAMAIFTKEISLMT